MVNRVQIDSGPISANDQLQDVPKSKWRDLMLARRQFMEINLSYDCRCLVQFVNDAEPMHQVLGFKDAKTMVRDGYKLEPAEVKIALKWLDLNPSDQPVALKVALGQHGGDRKSEKFQEKDQLDNINLKGGTQSAYLRARLERDAPDILTQLEQGEFKSVRAAAIAGGIIKNKSPLDHLRLWWRKASESERETFKQEIS
jgi:hypothetical protein